jgi:exodeoxyribonuclease V
VKLSAQQEAALGQIRDWIDLSRGADFRVNPKLQVYGQGGYAGTGKSTIAAEAVKTAPGRVMFLAPTGKAAHVLHKKGCENAATIHSCIYIPKGEKLSERVDQARRELRTLDERLSAPDLQPGEREGIQERQRALRKLLKVAKDEARPLFTLNEASELAAPDVWGCVVDEASMVDDRVANDLRSFGKPILALFDPAQLPPVRGSGGLSKHAHNTLTEIHRQGKASGILEYSMLVREGAELRPGRFGDDCEVYRAGDLPPDELKGMVTAADQVLVGRNVTRRKYNQRMRQLRGTASSGPWPTTTDRVVCLRNDANAGVLNGSCWTVQQASTDVDAMVTTMWCTSAEDDEDEISGVQCWSHHFVGREEEIPVYQIKDQNLFDYGYALTVHKSQGSQWDRVVVFDESHTFPDAATMWRRHLYTAVTRAAKHLVVIR